MASPPITQISTFNFVGAMDSGWHNHTILDSAQLELTDNSILSSFVQVESFLNRPIKRLGNFSIDGASIVVVSDGGGEPPAPTSAERWE